MAKGKKNKQNGQVFIPTRLPQGSAQQLSVFQKYCDKQALESSNNTLNLVASAFLISLHDHYHFSNDNLEDVLEYSFKKMQDVADNLATINNMMNIVKSYGINIYDKNQGLDEYGEIIRKKSAVYQVLEEGITEIEDIVNKCKIRGIQVDYREASGFRWEYNKEKYWEQYKEVEMTKKDKALAMLDTGATMEQIMDVLDISQHSVHNYTWMWNKESPEERKARQEKGVIEMANKNKVKAFKLIKDGASENELISEMGITKAAAMRYLETYREEINGGEIEVMTESMKEAFKLFDLALPNVQVREKLSLGPATINNYRAEWIRINKKDLSSDEMAEVLAEETTIEVAILRNKGVLPQKTKKEVAKVEHKAEVKDAIVSKPNMEKVIEEKKEVELKQAVIKVENKAKEEVPVMSEPIVKKGLKKIVKVIEMQGEFATYKPVEQHIDVELEGQVITLSKAELLILSSEFAEVAAEL